MSGWYSLKTQVGTFTLTPQSNGHWLLAFERHPVRSYPNSDAAAEAVAGHTTGVPEWDASGEAVPPEIGRWSGRPY